MLLLHVEDTLRTGGDLDSLEVLLDRAMERGEGFVPERLSWCASCGLDAHGIFAVVHVEGCSVRLRYIPPGGFWMGSPVGERGRLRREEPRHKVSLRQGYWISETLCTQGLWQAVTQHNPSGHRDSRCPVENVTWYDCQSFFVRLNALCPGLQARLPTEAQWERACRGGGDEARYGVLDEIAWYSENSGRGTHPVGMKAPNPLGLYDMLGNVWEWCWDWWDERYIVPEQGVRVDPLGPAQGAWRVVRGGSWDYDAFALRAASRDGWPPSVRYINLGFRLVIMPGVPLWTELSKEITPRRVPIIGQ